VAVVDIFVATVLVTHQRYGAGDTIGFSKTEWEGYQADAPGPDREGFRKLVKLQHIEKPDGSIIVADDRGRITDKSEKVPADKVVRQREIRSAVGRLAFSEKLSADDHRDLLDKALGDDKLDVSRFKDDPAGYFQGKHQANRQGAGASNTRG
jgi:hypothetical protein